MATQLPRFNTEEHFVLASLNEFVKTWTSGKESSLHIECKNGQAWLQLGFQLSHPASPHIIPSSPPQHCNLYPAKQSMQNNVIATVSEQKSIELQSRNH